MMKCALAADLLLFQGNKCVQSVRGGLFCSPPPADASGNEGAVLIKRLSLTLKSRKDGFWLEGKGMLAGFLDFGCPLRPIPLTFIRHQLHGPICARVVVMHSG